jgi:O-6-methylguanine DNA methyltransferase
MTTARMQLSLSHIETPLGRGLVGVCEQGILRAFDWAENEARLIRLLHRQYGALQVQPGLLPPLIRSTFGAYFEGELHALHSLPTACGGTYFQQSVWAALSTISAGSTMHYQQLAALVEKPRSARPVGMATGENVIALVIPCHRVIGKGGHLTGYAGGLKRKRWLLIHEGASFVDIPPIHRRVHPPSVLFR